MSRPPLPVASALAALALLVSACGDSSGGVGSDEADASDTPSSEAGEAADDPGTSTTAPESDASSDSDSDSGSDDADSGSDSDDAETDADADDNDDAPDRSEPDAPSADVVISGSLNRGELQVEDRRFDVPIGSSVLITFESDEVEHIHLHGYDLLVDLAPGEPAEISFVADSPGTFEVELEDSGRFLFELLVR